ncbi:hypothetical protein [Flocculibacter collagenilyticus]|uniref:hypothetical protein n=1 Tax=Flocculibacter collagenilyticus TaxID=2744479 RepID=UPI0018F49D10|nr:hypothetical protein [Flocculibacter collagenilyticus]
MIDDDNRGEDGTIGISQHGQYFEYDTAGRANFIINDKGLTAQQLSYTAIGYLDTVRQTYSTHSDATRGRNTTVACLPIPQEKLTKLGVALTGQIAFVMNTTE